MPASAVAIYVREIGRPEADLDLHADAPLNPASVMKLVTTWAALERLGPAYTWTTGVYATAPVIDGVLQGDLYLQGGGDPKLGYEQFWRLLRQLRNRGLRDIRGDLILDRQRFDTTDRDASPIDNQPLRAYNVGPDALLVNYKAVNLTFRVPPGAAAVDLIVEPRPAGLAIDNRLTVGKGECGDWKEGLHVAVERDRDGTDDRLVATGRFPAACGEKEWNLGVLPPNRYVLGLFRQFWQDLGGRFGGGLRAGAVPDGAVPLVRFDSPALAEIVRDINKYSNNVMARQLLLTLGAEAGARPARTADGAAAVHALLQEKGLRFPELVIDNGAGLSRQERISARSLGRLLMAAWASPLMPEFVASLPLAGVDGTMKKRLGDQGVAGHAHLKTGTLEGVKSVAGYVQDRSGRPHVVVFLVNHPKAGATQPAQDALLQWVYDHPSPSAPHPALAESATPD